MANIFKPALILLVVAGIVTFVLGVNEDAAKEGPCFSNENDTNHAWMYAVEPDEAWVSSVKTWYYPLASRLDLYRCAHDLLETDYADIPELPLYFKSCLEWNIDSEGYTITGFGGKVRHLSTTPVGLGTVDYKSEWEQGMVGRAYTTLTDNSTFMFTVCCFEDNQLTWNVFSTTKTIERSTLRQILDHLVSLGFRRRYVAPINYDHCHEDENGNFTLPSS